MSQDFYFGKITWDFHASMKQIWKHLLAFRRSITYSLPPIFHLGCCIEDLIYYLNKYRLCSLSLFYLKSAALSTKGFYWYHIGSIALFEELGFECCHVHCCWQSVRLVSILFKFFEYCLNHFCIRCLAFSKVNYSYYREKQSYVNFM